ncbi:MAG: hypothetical protein PHP42_07305 [Bacteroidota bacterium]|nr:hypothetical protein [Bacteroidota bacterium]
MQNFAPEAHPPLAEFRHLKKEIDADIRQHDVIIKIQIDIRLPAR